MTHFEIERKFLIQRPPESFLREHAVCSEIVQTYLLSPCGVSERVRRRENGQGVVYTHTVKTHVSDLRRIEQESEISEAEYRSLLLRADPGCHPIRKQRWVMLYLGQSFEIDVFPFWEKQAYLELELNDEEDRIAFPPEIHIIRELTDDGRYTNSALARQIPAEEI